jgi:PEP-CTERM motif
MLARFATLLALFVAIIIATPFSTPAVAAPIDLGNDVSIVWQDAIFGPVSFQVFGAPRLVPNASNAGALVTLDLDLFFGTDLFHDDGITPKNVIDTVDLKLLVGDSSFEEVIVGGQPLVLTYHVNDGANLIDWFASNPNGIIPLGLFDNFDSLPPGDLTFSVRGEFEGLDHSTTLKGRITMAGAGSLISVPEPTTLSMVLVGVGLVSASRRAMGKRDASRRRE